MKYKHGDIITLRVEKASSEGIAIGRIDELVAFVEGAVPGDTITAFVVRHKKKHIEARVLEVIEPSPHRVEPPCTHFGACGGCRWQMLAYEEQLRWKREHVRDAFMRIGGFAEVRVEETLGAESAFYYRNKMEYSFGADRWWTALDPQVDVDSRDPFTLGLHVPRRYEKILHIDACWLQSERSNAIVDATRRFFLERGRLPYSTSTHTGDLRHLVIREAKRTGESLVYLITTNTPTDIIDAFGDALIESVPDVTTFVHGVTTRKSLVAQSNSERVVFGDGVIRERLGDCMFEISPSSFFQSNTAQAEKLYGVARDYAEFALSDVVWDLYCGIGTIALFVAPHVSRVVGVEVNPDAIRDAEKNALRNAIHNAEFVCDDIVRFITHPDRESRAPDVIIVDPPRAGLHPDVVKAIGASNARRVVYVSCNPATCARDVQLLAAFGYSLEVVQPVDMFPQTYHIECVAKLTKERTDPSEQLTEI